MRRWNRFVCTALVTTVLIACGGAQKPAETSPTGAATTGEVTSPAVADTSSASPPEEAAGELGSQLKLSKLTLLQGIQQAERANGAAISAKFELEHGRLSLSVYTAKSGLDKDAEHNVLMELSGDPSKGKWEPKTEVFEDKEHVTRAAMHLTLVQRAKTTLSAMIAKASAKQPGTVYSITPSVRDKKPAFDVGVLTPEAKNVTVLVEAG